MNSSPLISRIFQTASEHFQAGRLLDAENAYKLVLQSIPEHPDALHYLGIISHQSGKGDDAVELIKRAINSKPSAPMYCNLGIVLQSRGNFDDAIANYQQAIRLKPAQAELYYYLGDTLKAQGNLEAAVSQYTRALELQPDFIAVYVSLGNTFHHLNKLSEAESCYRKVLDQPDNGAVARGDMLNEYASVLFKLGRFDEAAREYKNALQLKPGNQLITQHYRAALAKLIPSWHFSMLSDHDRNAAFRKAIDKHCAGAGLVLEIGTGSGLLAMMAARAGAAKVVTCEAVPAIAENATGIIAENGYANQITVYPVRSTGLVVGRELPDRADILLAEVLSSEILAEGALDTLADAKARLIKPGARIIPHSVTICAALVSGSRLHELTSVKIIEGFDLSLFNEFAPALITVPRGIPYEVVSETFQPFSFLMGERLSAPTSLNFPVRVNKSAVMHGIVQWMKVFLDEEDSLENNPGKESATDHWGGVFHPFLQGIQAESGQELLISCKIEGTSLKLGLA